MLELSIPQPGESSKQAKDLIFTILTKEQSLSLIQLYNLIKKEYNVSITYQAVRKAVEGLLEQGVLLKSQKQYYLSKKWVLELKGFFDELFSSFDSGKTVHTFSSDLIKDNYASYTLHSLFDLDVFWGDVLMHLADNLSKDEKKFSMNYGSYIWWMLINLGRETKLYDYYKKKNIDTYFIWFRDVPLNQYGSNMYNKIGHTSLVIETDEINHRVAFNTVGDTIIEVRYPKEIVEELKILFEATASLDDLDMRTITELTHRECNIKFIVYKNKELANSINETYLKYFKHVKP